MLQAGESVKRACAYAVALAPKLGFDAYLAAATVALKVLVLIMPFGMSREKQLSYAAFVAAAF
jgi:hypothetical protein